MREATISNCYNKGTLEGLGCRDVVIGGILGKMYTTTSKISNSYNMGTISGNKATGIYVGGIVGASGWSASQAAGKIENSYCTTATQYANYYWNGSKNVTTTSGRIEASTLKTYASKLGGAFEGDTENINDGYPILKWQKVKNN